MEMQRHNTCTIISAGGKVMEADSVTFNVTAVVYQMVWAVAEHYKKSVFFDSSNTAGDFTARMKRVRNTSPCLHVAESWRRVLFVSSRYSCKQCTDSYPNSRTTPKTHTRSRSYTRSLTSSQVTCIKGFYPLFQCFEKVVGCKRCVKLKRSKSTPTEAPLSHRKHCSWYGNLALNTVTLWHHTTSSCHIFA